MQVRSLLATTAAAAVCFTPVAAQAAILFSTGGITATQPTTVRFTLQSAGTPQQFFTSNLFVYVVDPLSGFVDPSSAQALFRRNPPSGLPSPIGSSNDFTFLPTFTYVLGLTNYNPSDLVNPSPYSPSVFSTNTQNITQNGLPSTIPFTSTPNPNLDQQRVVFGNQAVLNGLLSEGTQFSSASSFSTLNNPTGPFLISFEDGAYDLINGSRVGPDLDFNDFQVRAEVIPAPPLLLGLLAMGARVFFKQRKALKA